LPSFSITRKDFYALYKYAMGMLGLPILTFIFMRTDIFVIGKLHSEYDLGLYSMSVTLAYVPVMFLSSVIRDIAMPHFASLQNNKAELGKALIKVTYPITYFSFPIVIFVLLYSKSILTIIYGKEYAAVSMAFTILSVTTFFKLLSVPIAGMYMAIGEPGKHRFFTIIRASLIIIFIYPAVKYFGLAGAASAGLTAILIGFVLQFNKLNDIISLNNKKYFMSLIPAAGFSSLIIIIWAFTNSFTSGMPVREILAGLGSCMIVYLLIIGNQLKAKKLFF
jgi:O-antigen/teichoic acid export membrane protein